MTDLGSTALISLLTLAGPGARGPSPEAVLAKTAAGADALDIVMREPSREARREAPPTDTTLLTIKGPEAIAELLGLIQTTAVAENPLTWHTSPAERRGQFIRLRRGTKEVAAFTFRTSCLGRPCPWVMEPYAGRLWSGGDAVLAGAAAHAMAAWFHRHGWPGFQQGVVAADAENARWAAFHAAIPPGARRWLEANPNTPGTPAIPVDPLSVEVPDEVQRARLLCRALGLLAEPWFSSEVEVERAVGWARRIPAASLARAIEGFAPGSPELRGAGSVLFDGPTETRWLDTVPAELAERMAVPAAAQVFTGGDSPNARQLPPLLSSFQSPAMDRVLQGAAGRAAVRTCPADGREETRADHLATAPLGALVLLADRGRAAPAFVQEIAARPWSCPVDRAAADIALALATGRLPAASALEGADANAARTVFRRCKAGLTAAVDLAVSVLDGRPSAARREAEVCLASLSGLSRPAPPKVRRDAEDERLWHAQLRDWWRQARPTWTGPRADQQRGGL